MKFAGICFFFYFAIQCCWWPTIDCQEQTCGYLEFSSSALITSLNCTVHFQCESKKKNVDCYKKISYTDKEDGDLQNAKEIENCVQSAIRTECQIEFSSSVYVWCFAPQSANKLKKSIRLKVLDHLEKVQNMSKNDTDCIVWTKPPNTSDIELKYIIKFMYNNGTFINSTTSNLTEYCLVNRTFDERELISVSVVAKAVCGDASSNITWWNGSVLESKTPWNSFKVSLAMVENGVAIYISYIEKKISCASLPLLLYANLTCYYENKRNESYKMKLIQHENYTRLVLNESAVLLPNEKANCSLTLGQWTRDISTFRVQNCSENNSTHICVEFHFLKGSALPECSARLTLNITGKKYPFELNIAKSEECFRQTAQHSLLDESDQSQCCVTCDQNRYCRSAEYNNNAVATNKAATQEWLGVGGAGAVLLVICMICMICLYRSFWSGHPQGPSSPSRDPPPPCQDPPPPGPDPPLPADGQDPGQDPPPPDQDPPPPADGQEQDPPPPGQGPSPPGQDPPPPGQDAPPPGRQGPHMKSRSLGTIDEITSSKSESFHCSASNPVPGTGRQLAGITRRRLTNKSI